jgi:hypothetical protein
VRGLNTNAENSILFIVNYYYGGCYYCDNDVLTLYVKWLHVTKGDAVQLHVTMGSWGWQPHVDFAWEYVIVCVVWCVTVCLCDYLSVTVYCCGFQAQCIFIMHH